VAQRLIEVETLDEVEFSRLFPSPHAARTSTPVPKGVALPAGATS